MVEFKIFEDLKKCKDSILLESDNCIAYYIRDNYMIELQVRGEIEILYKNEYYTNLLDFPQELIDIINNGKNSMYETYEDIEIINNNWFNIEFYKKVEDNKWEFLEDTSEGEQDYSNYTEEQLFKELKDYYNVFVEEEI